LSKRFSEVTPYNVTLYEDADELKAALLAEFRNLREWLTPVPARWFEEVLEYPGNDGNPRHVRVSDGLLHVFTHAVHHRGQISAALTQLKAPSPEMDFVFYRFRAAPLKEKAKATTHALD
jgi:uncharacterized damage-inducible protein DinB